MRTNIDIDEMLIAEVMERSGVKTKREAVNDALLAKAAQLRQSELRRFKGALSGWDGNLDDMRANR
jgi:Arc/MetJ family transcription regulator